MRAEILFYRPKDGQPKALLPDALASGKRRLPLNSMPLPTTQRDTNVIFS
jgi:hypothetical protein